MTIAELTVLAQQIRDETNPGANTALRVGDLFQNIIDTLAERTPPPAANMISGRRISTIPVNVSITEGTVDADTVSNIPLIITQETTLDQLGFYFRSSDPANDIEVAIYNSENFLPTTQIANTLLQVTDPASNTFVSVDFPVDETLSPGLYFVAIVGTEEITLLGNNDGGQLFYFDMNVNASSLESKLLVTLLNDSVYSALPASQAADTFTSINDSLLFALRLA